MKLLRIKTLAISCTISALTLWVARTFASTPPPVFSWAQRAGGSDSDGAIAVSTDTNSNVYVVSTVLSTNADFGPFTFSSGSPLAKYNAQGGILWARRVGSSGYAATLATDSAGNSYVGGSFPGTSLFDGATLFSAGQNDLYLAKFDPNGNFIWARRGGGTNMDWALDVALEADGTNFLMAGAFYGASTTIGSSTFNSGMNFGNQIFVTKWTTAGTYVWGKAATGVNIRQNSTVTSDSLGNVYWAGAFVGTANFGTTNLISSPSNQFNAFLAKYDSNGALLDLKRFPGTNSAVRVLCDSIGNVYLVGTFNGGLTFPGVNLIATNSTSGYGDVFVAKYSPAGTLLWAKQGKPGGQQNFYEVLDVSLDPNGNVFFSGDFQYGFNFGPVSLVHPAGADAFFAAGFTKDGDYLWAKSGAEDTFGSSLATDNSNRLFVAGSFRGTAGFDSTNLTSAGFSDVYISSMDLTPPAITLQPFDQTNRVGSNVVFSAAATGRAPLTYQWFSKGLPISGETNATLALTNLQYNQDIFLDVFSPGAVTQTRTAMVAVTYFPGEELKPPPGAVLTNSPLTGPPVSGSGATCWVPDPVTRGHLYASVPGSIIITWKDAATNDLIVSALILGYPAQKFELGQEIPPPSNASLNPAPISSVPSAVFWHEATKKLYAVAPVSNCVVTWQNGTCIGSAVSIENTWPTNQNRFQLHIANTPPVALTNWGATTDAKLLAQDPAAGVDGSGVTNNISFFATGAGRSLLLLSPDNPQITTNIYFQFINTLPYYEPTNLHTGAAAIIGRSIGDPFNYNTASNAAPYVFNSLSRYCVTFHNRATRTGPIIPVNRDGNAATNDDMIVVYYQQGLKLFEPGTGLLLSSSLAWPWKPVRYDCQWPPQPDGTIVIASQDGSGPVPLTSWSIYRQNTPNQAGYNPNEEHALKLPARTATGSLKLDSSGVQVLEGSSVPVTVSLSSTNNLPAANIVLSISSSRDGDPDLGFSLGQPNVTEVTLTPQTLADGYTFFITANPDSNGIEGTNSFTVRVSGGLFADQTVVAREMHTNTLALVVSSYAFAVPEGGTKSISVRLTQPPPANISVNIRRDPSAAPALTIQSPSVLSFTPGNWDQPQTITMAAAEDGDFFSSTANRFYLETSGAPIATNVLLVDELDNDVPPDAVFALRSDLGDPPGTADPQYSEPYVLLAGTNNLNQPALLVYRVVAEQPTNVVFRYSGVAGRQIQPPYPLSLLVGWEQSSIGVSGPYWQDRKKFFWAKAAGDNGGSADVVMRFFYPVQNGFDFPKLGLPPTVGSLVPWLDDLPGGIHGQPVNIAYQITWPDLVPDLRVGETLVKPKFGLPAIAGQTSVDVLYQQSLAKVTGNSVNLIDPTFPYSASLSSLPSDLTGKVATNVANGNVFFVNLPPHLRGRLWFEPLNQKLKFKGEFRAESGSEEPAGYLLLNVLTSRDKSFLLDPALSADTTFVSAINNLSAQAAQARTVVPNATFDSLALSAGLSQGTGYVTLAFNNATNSTTLPPGRGTPISLEIIRVTCPTYRGEVKVVTSDNPLDEKLTLRHSGDFSGRADSYVFEWKYRPPPSGGGKPTVDDQDNNGQPDGWLAYPTVPPNGQGALDITVAGSGLQTLIDNWYICRYRSTNSNYPCGTNWSLWTEPALAEGWIKRALAGINPFDQKFADYSSATVDTIVNMISQAGARSLGTVPLDVGALSNYGLIEIYETILKRGMELSVDGNPPVSDPAANKALLGAARRLADLYLLLGNEAYADASDPTIGFGTDGQYANEAAPSIFCFMDQVSSLLDEELGLMRGLDDSFGRNVRQHPAYNHLRWNFTRNITGGEVAYALNYNIRAQSGSTNISAATSQRLYPQGHGDAWGHYLSAIKYYYHLLRNPNFDWNPDIEFVTLGGIGEPIPVNYLDERKFAKIAAAKAQTGAEIVNLTYRSYYSDDPSQQWQGYLDANTNRAWGVSEWASRSGQGAFLDWALGNALLPATSPNQGIQKVDRTTVTELRETAAAFLNIQEQLDKADAGLNPLGLVNNVVPFDINPNEIDNNTTHFEQIYARAVRSLNNAIAVFNYANNSSQMLRRQADTVNDFQKVVADKEADFKNRLIEAFGYPYSDDIGPLGAYPSGYDGPDLYHYMYVDPSRLLGIDSPPVYEYTVPIVDTTVASDGSLIQVTNTVKFHVAPNGFGFIKPPLWLGSRRAPGELQLAHLDLLQAKARFERALAEYDNLLAQMQSQADLLQAQYALNDAEINIINTTIGTQQTLNDKIRSSRIRQLVFRNIAQKATLVANALAEANPKVLGVIAGLAGGVIADATAPLRSAIQLSGAVVSEIMRDLADRETIVELDHDQAKEESAAQQNLKLTIVRQEQGVLQQVAQLEQLVRQEVLLRLEIYNQQEALQQASGRYSAALARGQRLLEDRLRFRQQTAEQIQSYRYKDMAFRIFRNDALQKYRAQFDLAAMYVYLAAKAYDFDTNLRPNDPSHAGSFFINRIVRARSLGLIQSGLPQTGGLGDPGLADPMAAMSGNFAVLKTQLGFDNTQQSAREFSLRSQLFRVASDSAGNANWREALKRYKVDNILDLPDFRRNCLFSSTQPQEPGLIIPIATTIDQDLNLFGWPAGAGDSSFNPTAFSTKVRSGGITFLNYRISGLAGLRQDPRVYLVPVGADIMRSPRVNSFDSINYTREWRIQDQWLPAPFPISNKLDPRLIPTNWIPALDLEMSQGFALSQLAEVRAHASFDAFYPGYPNATPDDPQFESTRIIGRSVWNTRWLLVIPAVNLLSTDRQEALARFIDGGVTNSVSGARDLNGITDIRLRFKTYAYTGR
jgi:hypothetical protein